MNAYLASRSCLAFAFLAFFVLFGWLLCLGTIAGEYVRENRIRNRVGADWEEEYVKEHGSLSKARTKVGFAVVGMVAIPALSTWLYRSLRPKQHSGRSRERSRHGIGHWFRSRFGGFQYHRRNGTVAITLGVFGILVSAFLAMFRVGLFEDHSDEVVLSMGVYLLSYACVLTGSYWWVKAKAWNEAVVFIGVMPLAILFIPYVRLIFVAAPMVLVISMLMMPLVLVAVVVALPDKTRPARRRSRRHRNEY